MKNVTKKKLLLGLVMVSIFGVLGLTGCTAKKVDLNKYIEVEVSGYNGMGTATVTFDEDAYYKDYKGKIEMKKSDEDFPKYEEATQLLYDECVDWSTSQRNDLSNGDVIEIEWTNDDESAAEYFGIKFKCSTIEYKVSGLEEVETFDPFEAITITFTGNAPDAVVQIDVNRDNPAIQDLHFGVDKERGLSNGDVITISANITGDVDEYVTKYGAINPTKKEITVSGLSGAVMSTGEIPDDVMNEFKSRAEASFNAHKEESWDNSREKLVSFEYIGNYFFGPQEGMFSCPAYRSMLSHNGGSASNRLDLVYKVEVEDDGVLNTYYYNYSLGGIIADENGNITVENEGVLEKEVHFNNNNFWYYGAEDLEALKNILGADEYKYEANIK